MVWGTKEETCYTFNDWRVFSCLLNPDSKTGVFFLFTEPRVTGLLAAETESNEDG